MAITVNAKTSALPLDGGQEGLKEQLFNCSWSTTDVTGTIAVLLKKVKFIFIGQIDVPADAETIAWGDTLLSDKSFTVGADGLITLGRVVETGGSITSGGSFCVRIVGW